MRSYSIIFALLLTLGAQAAARGPSIDVIRLKVIGTAEGLFLEAQLDPPEGGAILTAVSTPFGKARLESRGSSGYQVAAKIPITHQQGTLGAGTQYRLRLPEASDRQRTVPVTLLFLGGSLVQAEAEVAVHSIDYRPWAGAAGVVVLALTALGIARVKMPPLRL